MRRGDFVGSISPGVLELHAYEQQTAAGQPADIEPGVCRGEPLQSADLDWERAWVDLGGEG